MRFSILLAILGWSFAASANLSTDPDLPLAHCYHWVREAQQQVLTNKYAYAKANGGELTFFNSTGVAGNGLYCAKTLNGSFTYGDRVIRIDFVPDVVFTSAFATTKTCGTDGKFYSDNTVCQSKPEDVNFYNSDNDWYVIRNQNVIQYWSANSDQLIADLKAAENDPITSPQSKAKFEATIELINAERAKMPKMTIFNSKSRIDILKVLKSPAILARANPTTLIDQLVSYPADKISPAQFNLLAGQLVARAFKDKTSSVSSSFAQSVDASATLQRLVRAQLALINAKTLSTINGDLLFVLSSSKSVTVPASLQDYAWNEHLKSPEGLASLPTLADTDPRLKRVLANFVTPLTFAKSLKQMTASQAAAFGTFLNKQAPAGKDFGPYIQLIYAKLASTSSAYALANWLNTFTNPSLHKDTVVQTLFSNPVIGEVLSPGRQVQLLASLGTSVIPEDKANTIRVQLALRAATTDDKDFATYALVSLFKTVKWPDDATRFSFFNKLIERSIRERGQPGTTSSTYRLLLSGILEAVLYPVQQATGAERVAAADKARNYFLGLATRLSTSTYSDYAYPALELASVMKIEETTNYVQVNPLIEDLPLIENVKSTRGQLLLSLGAKSLDTNLITIALKDITTEHKAVTGSRQLVHRMLAYLATPAFAARIKDAGFIIANTEKMNWASIPNSTTGSRGDACTFNRTLQGALAADLSAQFSDVWPAALQSLKAHATEMCATK